MEELTLDKVDREEIFEVIFNPSLENKKEQTIKMEGRMVGSLLD